MIHIAFDEYTDSSERIFLFSDKSNKEMKDFTERANRYWKKNNTPSLGVHYTREITLRQKEREAVGNYGFENSGIPFEITDYYSWLFINREDKKKMPSSNVKELTAAAHDFLKKEYDLCHKEVEFTHTNIDVRADLFAVTKDRKVISVEVKSDKDTLARLEKQLKGYKVFSHIVYIAVDIKHFAKVENLIRKTGGLFGVGILIYENGQLIEEDKPYHFSQIDATKMLWKDEYLNMLWEFDIKGKRKLSVDRIIAISKSIFTVKEYSRLSEYLFTERYLKKNSLDYVTSFYSYSDHKKEVIQDLFSAKEFPRCL